MQEIRDRLFWDGSPETFSREARVKRLFEYGSFPEIVRYPFEEIQTSLRSIQINLLRTSESRKKMLMYLKPYLLNSKSWSAALTSYIRDCLYKES